MRNRFFHFMAGAVVFLGSVVAGPAQEDGARVVGKVLIPDSSIERPDDLGHRVHTNHRVLLEPTGGLGPAGGMTPAQLRAFYGFSSVTNLTGGGVIAIVDAYDYPTALADFNTFSARFGLPLEDSSLVNASTNKVFQVVYASGRKPKANAGWSQEAALDIEWAHAMAPAAKIVLVEANSNSFADMFAAVDVAARIPGLRQVSMSWGGSESSSEAANDKHFPVNGPIFFASSGDAGGKVIYPSSSQYVVAVGGTSVATDGYGNLTRESAWSDGGGGNSKYITKPAWQVGISNTGSNRGTPDISSDADPYTGVAVYDSTPYRGMKGWMVFGGTSVSAPCVAGMVNASGVSYTGTTAFLTNLYQNHYLTLPWVFRDITTGSNGFSAVIGWDYATGLGAPTGEASF